MREVSLPASDPLVLGVGGTTLTANPRTGAHVRESAWSASGGGFSHLYARPAYQAGIRGISATRGVPDVAGDADEVGGMALVVTTAGVASLDSTLGTSNSAPLWGGLVALADQYAHHDLGFINPAIYRIAHGPSYHRAFHDITTGTNGYPAARGWDPVTGWETPDARVLIPLLSRYTAPGADSELTGSGESSRRAPRQAVGRATRSKATGGRPARAPAGVLVTGGGRRS